MVGRTLERHRVASGRAGARRHPHAAAADRSRAHGRYPGAEVSLTVYRGEVLGIAGLIGAGRSELAEAVCGVGLRLSGRVLLEGRPLPIASARDAIRHGVCLVPEDRRRCGVVAEMSVRENITLPALPRSARAGLVVRRAEAEAVAADRDRAGGEDPVDRNARCGTQRRQPAAGRARQVAGAAAARHRLR